MNLFKRNVEGVLLLDKPKNVSSACVLSRIKKIFHANKAGHTGTLDVLATGMLPVCFGKATKLAQYLLNSNKRYQAVVQLGITTDTFDAKGTVVRVVPVVKLDINKLKKCLECFKGKSYQIPPMFSSIKYRGIPLYKYARRNLRVPRDSREIYIYDLSVTVIGADVIELIIHCSKGTYIRSIVNDLGERLGYGAHVTELRRLTVGRCLSESMITVKTVESIFNNRSLSDEETLQKLDTLLISIDMVKLLYIKNNN